MRSYAATRSFRPSSGTDWAPTIEEITSVVVGIGPISDTDLPLDTNRERVEHTLGSIHDDGFTAVFTQLETFAGHAYLSIGAVAAATTGGSSGRAAGIMHVWSTMWGVTTLHDPWTHIAGELPGGIGDTIRFRRSPGLGIEWSTYHWAWPKMVRAVAREEEGTSIRVAFLSTTDTDASPTHKRPSGHPLDRLWVPELTMTVPHRVSNTAAGRFATNLVGAPSWQTLEWLDTKPDLAAAALGVPIVGGTRHRTAGSAVTTSAVASLLGTGPVQLRFGEHAP